MAPLQGHRMGYLVPEFPGQTHNFFWREIRALQALGIEISLISTRKPPAGLMSTSWGDSAEAKTTYLFPIHRREWLDTIIELGRAGPMAVFRCIRAIASARNLPVGDWFRLVALVLFAAKMKRVARVQGWRYVHVHSCGDAAHVAMLAFLLGGPEYGLTLHSALSCFGGNQRQKWRHARCAIVITRTLEAEVRRELEGDLPLALGVASLGVETNVFQRASPYQPFLGSGEFHIACCSRLNVGKGHLDLVDAIAQLLQRGLNVRLSIAGEDDLGGTGFRVRLTEKINALSLGKYVTLLGAQSEEGVRTLLSTAHAFALASHEEALGVALMEAMSMELPVVATRVGGVPELITDGQQGVLVPSHDSSAIADALERIAHDPELARTLGVSGRLRVEQSYGSDKSATLIAKMTAGLVGVSGSEGLDELVRGQPD